jgi:8-oxo-dGTP pyrophosphatase MutT (NUDIX family)
MMFPPVDQSSRNPEQFMNHVRRRLYRHGRPEKYRDIASCSGRGSVVLLPLTQHPEVPVETVFAPSLIMNKRSDRVRQAGDLCYPGGSISTIDRLLSLLLRLTLLPVAKWPDGNGGMVNRKTRAAIAVLLATGLREAWEEMRLNPLRLDFLGPLPVERLILFDRRIHPLAVWAAPRQKYRPNWEVQRIVHLPLSELLKTGNHARFQPTISGAPIDRREEFPCFIHQGRQGREILWGVSYRITMCFMQRVFDFEAPALEELPIIEGRLSAAYLNNSRRAR